MTAGAEKKDRYPRGIYVANERTLWIGGKATYVSTRQKTEEEAARAAEEKKGDILYVRSIKTLRTHIPAAAAPRGRLTCLFRSVIFSDYVTEKRARRRGKEERRKTERNEPKEATQSAIGAELSMIPGARPRVPKRSLAVVGTSLRNVGAVFAD